MTYILILIGVYFAALSVLAIAARPQRKRLLELGEALQQESMTPVEREFITMQVSSTYSWRSAIILSLLFLSGLFRSIKTIERECAGFDERYPFLANDERVFELMDLHFVSAIAVNPLFGMLAIVFRQAFRIKLMLRNSDSAETRKAVDIIGLAATA